MCDLNKKNISEILSKRKKRKLEKLNRKQNLSVKTTTIPKKSKYETCLSCSNPKGSNCSHSMCKPCCRKKTFNERLECNGK